MKKAIYAYYIFSFFSGLHFFSAVLVPMITIWGGVTIKYALILQSIFSGAIFLFEVPTGVVADRLGRKASILIGQGLIIVGFLIYTSQPNFWIFACGEVLLALATAFISGADEALIYEALPGNGKEKEKLANKIYAKSNAIHMTGIVIAAIAGGFIASSFGLIAPMKASIIPTTLATVAILFIPEVRGSNEEKEGKDPWWITAIAGLKQLKNNQPLRILSIRIIGTMTAGYFVIWLYQPLTMYIGWPITTFGIIHGLLAGSQIVVSAIYPKIPKVVKKAIPVIVGLSFAISAIWPNTASLILFVSLGGGFGLTSLKLNAAKLNRYIDENGNGKSRATVLSTISMFRRGSTAILNPIIGSAGESSVRLALLLVGAIPFAVSFLLPKED
jgi:MFS family permease